MWVLRLDQLITTVVSDVDRALHRVPSVNPVWVFAVSQFTGGNLTQTLILFTFQPRTVRFLVACLPYSRRVSYLLRLCPVSKWNAYRMSRLSFIDECTVNRDILVVTHIAFASIYITISIKSQQHVFFWFE